MSSDFKSEEWMPVDMELSYDSDGAVRLLAIFVYQMYEIGWTSRQKDLIAVVDR